ncbi:MAG: 5-formyltetrahydrofolate cyclo-ligase [Proteobacteria bacterium]|nr:MAG: 5-formyltetrahydrofolate cyclo-ligase [Pseudomonadota bacterium]
MGPDKKSLRDKLIKDRLAISFSDWQARSLRICERVALLAKFEHIALYKSFRNEVDVSSLMELLPSKAFYFPKTNLGDGSMEFIRYDASKPFVKNRWGVEEPDAGEPLVSGAQTLIIVPALAFDKDGHRLGYGKGFYDRFLSSFTATTIGVCFSEFFFESLPSEAHDRVVNHVVTELGSLDVTR